MVFTPAGAGAHRSFTRLGAILSSVEGGIPPASQDNDDARDTP